MYKRSSHLRNYPPAGCNVQHSSSFGSGWSIPAALILLLATGLSARAQMGTDEAGHLRQWGAPVAAVNEAEGVRALTFTTNALTIRASLLNGVVHRVAYSQPEFTARDVKELQEILSYPWGQVILEAG